MFKGKTTEELQAMSVKEFAEILPSRKKRTITRGFTDSQKIFLKKLKEKDNIKTHCRSIIILPFMIGKIIRVYDGKTYQTVRVNEEMVGHILGEFVPTRKGVAHSAPGIGATRSTSSISVK